MGEVSFSEYQQRRERLMAKLGNSTAIFRSAPTAVMHNDVEYNFRQDSDFYYLTGFNEPEAVAVLAPHHEEHQFVLFVRPKDALAETWSGYRVGVEAAQEQFGADAVFSIAEISEKLPGYLEKADCIYYRLGRDQTFNQQVLDHWQNLMRTYPKRGTGPVALADPAPVLHPLRQIKSPSELALMRRAATVAAEAHNRALALRAPGRYEYEIQADIEYFFRTQGAMGPAYPSIVASGTNACILHYTENTRQMQGGELLLVDAGCAWGYYNSDITRTYPVGDRFTTEQRILYELVLAAQTAAIAQVKPGQAYGAIHDTAVRVLVDGLLNLGLLKGDSEEIIKEEKYKPFYMHRTGHWLGLDVHDVGVYQHGEELPYLLQPGNVFTIEPGIYISPTIELAEDQPPVPDHWRGIGIRIEDDVVVTETGYEVLTAGTPKAIADLER